MNNRDQQILDKPQTEDQQQGLKATEENNELCCNYDDNYYGDQACAPCDQVAVTKQ